MQIIIYKITLKELDKDDCVIWLEKPLIFHFHSNIMQKAINRYICQYFPIKIGNGNRLKEIIKY